MGELLQELAGIAGWRNFGQHHCEPHLAQKLCQQTD